jgi:hypothetical protein
VKLATLFESNNLIGKSIETVGLNVEQRIVTPDMGFWKGSFYASNLKLDSLEGMPREIQEHCGITRNKLKTLKHGPDYVGGEFNCDENELTSLEFAPAIAGSFYCSENKITSLKDIHKTIKEINGMFYAKQNPIKSHVLGLLLIKGLTTVRLEPHQVETILNKHLPNKTGNKGLLACQNALLDAGFDEFAQI